MLWTVFEHRREGRWSYLSSSLLGETAEDAVVAAEARGLITSEAPGPFIAFPTNEGSRLNRSNPRPHFFAQGLNY